MGFSNICKKTKIILSYWMSLRQKCAYITKIIKQFLVCYDNSFIVNLWFQNKIVLCRWGIKWNNEYLKKCTRVNIAKCIHKIWLCDMIENRVNYIRPIVFFKLTFGKLSTINKHSNCPEKFKSNEDRTSF